MKQFVSHIDFLIQKHDCVIIPYFGGFVISHEFASIANDGTIMPPRMVVGFNPDLRYNDGLLAESYMNAYSISFDAACKKITDIVSRLNTILSLRQPIQIGNLGKLNLDAEGHLCFTPNTNFTFSYAHNYGLSTLNINRLVDIVEIKEVARVVNKKRLSISRVFTGIGAVAAAVLVFFVTSTPVLDNDIAIDHKAGFFTDILAPSSAKHEINDIDKIESLTTVAEAISSEINVANENSKAAVIDKVEADKDLATVTPKIEEPISRVETTEIKKITYPMYYIIVGSSTSITDAQNILRKTKNQGFKDADIVETSDRSRIYTASFENKSLAEKYLTNLKKDNPQFNDAWLYTKRR